MENRVYLAELHLIRPEYDVKATLCCCYFSCITDYQQLSQHLHAFEQNYFKTLIYEKRIRSYLLGRFAAKKAVAALTGDHNLRGILIQAGVFAQPVVTCNKPGIQVSITHCDHFGAALAFPETHPMGIDIERINLTKRDVLEKQITEAEKNKINLLPVPYDLGLTLLWTAKEALSKVLKTGLTIPGELLEISRFEDHDNQIVCYYKNFSQYKAVSFTVANYLFSIVHPLQTELRIDTQALQDNFIIESPDSRLDSTEMP
jgi:4'-phosphopantetheinyl transferase